MKKTIFILGIFLTSLFSYGQVLYSDNFNQGIINATTITGYELSIVNNRLHIQGNGNAATYEPIEYSLHNSGTNAPSNISSSPKIYIKAKASKPSVLRIDLRDAGGYVTNENPVSNFIDGQFWIYEYDLTGKLADAGWDEDGPCDRNTQAPCPVNASQIANLTLSIDPTVGGFSNLVEIEWISLGAPLEEIPTSRTQLRYNQVAYFTGRDKIINVISGEDFSPVAYQVFNSSNQQVLSGNSSAAMLWAEANEYTSVIDVSTLNDEGTYRLQTDFDEITFQINDEGYSELRKAAFKYYYLNRASTEITAQYGGEYARPFGIPDTNVRVHSSAASAARPEGTVISAPKGWYDAGDYNKYVVNSGISTYTLLAAYEHFSDYYSNLEFNIPEKGGAIPDILDEVIWNLDWMVAMQDPNDGGVYHKLTAKGFSGIIMPNAYNLQRYVVQKTTSASLNLAAVAAQASRIFGNYESVKPGYSAQLLQVAKDAYTWAKANPAIYYADQNDEDSPVSDISTGAYGDGDVTDEFQWAAVELYITSGEEQYKNDINISQIGGGIPYWGYVEPLALLSIAHHADDLSSTIDVATAMTTFMSTANGLKDKVSTSPMKIAMGNGDYNWGSNSQAANQVMLLIKAFEYSGDASFLQASYTAMDYVLGRNGTGYCFVSGFGNQKVLRPHHRISEADAVTAPVPGMLAGGPHSGAPTAENFACSGYPRNNSNATTYVDTWCSYASNEVTINWNAPLVYATNALHFYENESILSVDEISVANSFKVFPNPTQGTIKIISSKSISGAQIKIFSIHGENIFSTQLQGGKRSIDISSLSPGIYLMETKVGDTTYVEKVVKK